MATITEDYVSLETAKLLKDKGFNEPCECAYSAGGQYLLSCYKGIADRRIKNDEVLDFSYSSTAPTQQMAMKWLREVHSLCIGIYYLWPCGYEIEICKIGKDTPISEFEAIREYAYDTYEEAVESAIKYCLENLI